MTSIPEQIRTEWTEGVCDDGAAILRDGVPVSISDILARLNEVEQHDTPAWRANERLNERAEICYCALEQISKRYPDAGTIGDIARDALERACNVLAAHSTLSGLEGE